MNQPGYLVETTVVDPVTGEKVLDTPVVPDEAENLMSGGCCGGSCCQ